MEQALYRKYRSKNFAEVVGQEHITKTLSNAIKSGRISHAYLFTGPRGVGKTSVARILAHEVNSLPYNDESIHLDIIEIDAASNRRIDEIREIRERVHIAPTSAKYKIYIIDEVHMLTREAFNALLKTLEEPPAHCIFILATTEAHKLPETIVSRTQRFEFKPITGTSATKHLEDIAKQEKIDIEPEALELLAEYGEGSFRDSISLLDQLSTTGQKITTEFIRDFMGLPAVESIEKLLNALNTGDSTAIVSTLDDLIDHGSSPTAIAEALSKQLRARVIKDSSSLDKRTVKLLRDLVEVPGSLHPNESLELSLLEAVAQESAAPTVNKAVVVPKVEQIAEPEVEQPKPTAKKAKAASNFNLDQWPKVLETTKTKAASLYTALKLAKPTFEKSELTLNFEFPLHQKKINLAKNKQLVADIIEELSGASPSLICVVNKDLFKENVLQSSKTQEQLTTITNIFGDSEVLES